MCAPLGLYIRKIVLLGFTTCHFEADPHGTGKFVTCEEGVVQVLPQKGLSKLLVGNLLHVLRFSPQCNKKKENPPQSDQRDGLISKGHAPIDTHIDAPVHVALLWGRNAN